MSMKTIARSGAEGNVRLQKMYGAGSAPPRQEYPKGYATGGAVKAFASGGMVSPGAEGAPAKPSLGRPGRKMAKGKGGKKAGTNVNVVIMPKPDAPKGPDMAAGAPPSGPGPVPMPPPGAGPGGPPVPMRAKGGRVQDVRDGDEGQTQGAEREAMKLVAGRKSGGAVNAEKHTTGQDTKTEREAMSAITRKSGGKVLTMHAGANSGPGRIEKAAKQKRA